MKSNGHWDVSNMPNLNAAIDRDAARGLYVLEFESGEQYVGQATDVAKRIAQHRRNTSHHEAWTDIRRVEFFHIPEEDLNGPEQALIAERRADAVLRNRMFNLGHSQPSSLDPVVDRSVQSSWVDDLDELDLESIAVAARRPTEEDPRSMQSPHSAAFIDDLATIIELFIPSPTATEGRFWSISDWPNTNSGQRAYTLNAGGLELAYCFRAPINGDNLPLLFLNTEAGALISSRRGLKQRFINARRVRRASRAGHPYAKASFTHSSYDTTEVDKLVCPAGTLSHVLDAVPTPRQTIQDTRGLALNLMRQRRTPWANSHSESLTTHAYRRILDRGQLGKPSEYGVFDG